MDYGLPEGSKSTSLLAVDSLTLADRLVRDAGVAEVVAHRGKISERFPRIPCGVFRGQ
jgi:hypothetical protein